MKIFRKRKRALSARQLRLAEKIADRLLAYQWMIADWLNLKTADLHPRTCLFLLICFCACFGAYLIHLVLQVFN